MGKRSREEARPEITPLIDVVFLLLIFFMVSTVFKKSEMAILLNLPKMENGEAQEDSKIKSINLELNKNEVALNGKKVKIEELDAHFTKITKKDIPVDIRIDKEVQYERVVKLFDRLKKFNLNNISLITEK